MAQSLDARHRNHALLYTGATALLLTLLILFLKWRIEIPVKQEEPSSIEVELNLPPDPPTETEEDGGGGGGNPAQAIGPTGVAPEADPPAGDINPAKEINEPEEKDASIIKPILTKKEAPLLAKTSPNKATPKTEMPPAPKQPKNVLGKSIKGPGTGADTPDDFNKSGNAGTGSGVGRGPGSGGGSGTSVGGGSGSGVRSGGATKNYTFTGDLAPRKIIVRILVAPNGTGTFLGFIGGCIDCKQYEKKIKEVLSEIEFTKSDKEYTITPTINFTN